MFSKNRYNSYEELTEAHKDGKKLKYPIRVIADHQSKQHNELYFKYVEQIKQKELIIVDIGGGAGSHYNNLIKEFPDVKFKYYIVEEQRLVDSQDSTEDLIFAGDIKNINETNIDLVHCNGGLPYIKDDILKDILNLNPKCIVFVRIAITSEDKDFFVTQDYSSHTMPYKFIAENKFEIFDKAGYKRDYELVDKHPKIGGLEYASVSSRNDLVFIKD